MSDNVLRMLVAESSLEDAEYLVSTLRNAGIAARPTRVTAVEELQKVLEERALDVAVCAVPEGAISLAELVQAVKNSGKDIPVIAYVESPDPELIEDAIAQGANNVVFHGVPHHLQTTLARELRHVNSHRTLRRTGTALQESEKRCQALLNSAQDAIAYVHEGMHVYANRNYLQRFGFADFDEMAGLPLLDLVIAGDHQRLKDCLIKIARGEKVPDVLELEGKRSDGTPMPLCMEFAQASYDEETCTQIVIRAPVVEPEPEPEPAAEAELEAEVELGSEILDLDEEATEQSEPETDLEKEIDNLRAQDLLTGLYNRIYFMEQLELAVDSASENDACMLYAELDNYRGIIDQVGHVGADTIIADVARLIEDRQGQNDVAARFGDFSFTVLCQGRSVRSAEELAEEIRQAIEDHISEGKKHAVTVTASIGIAPISELTTEVQEVLANATAASAQANAQGGNRVEVFAPAEAFAGEHDGEHKGNAELAGQLRQALDKDRFFLVFQPLVSLHGHGGEYYETLLRMHGDDEEEIAAAEFLPMAEQYGMMKDIDRWVIHTAVDIVHKENQADRQVRLFLKISPQSLADESLIPWLRELIEETGIQGESLVFEFPESQAVTNLKPARVFVRKIKELKCGFVLEQFGTGVNSFQLLKHLPANYLKIDRGFSQELCTNEKHRDKIKEITDQGHALGKLIIAEFVEDAASMSVLYQVGVNYVQGNFLQEPEKMLSYDFS